MLSKFLLGLYVFGPQTHLLLNYVMPQVTFGSSVLVKMVRCAVLQILSAPGIYLMSKASQKKTEPKSSVLKPRTENGFLSNYKQYLKFMTLPMFFSYLVPSLLRAVYVLAW